MAKKGTSPKNTICSSILGLLCWHKACLTVYLPVATLIPKYSLIKSSGSHWIFHTLSIDDLTKLRSNSDIVFNNCMMDLQSKEARSEIFHLVQPRGLVLLPCQDSCYTNTFKFLLHCFLNIVVLMFLSQGSYSSQLFWQLHWRTNISHFSFLLFFVCFHKFRCLHGSLPFDYWFFFIFLFSSFHVEIVSSCSQMHTHSHCCITVVVWSWPCTAIHRVVCKTAAIFCRLQPANVASLLGTQGLESRQMKLTYKGKGEQLFLSETRGGNHLFPLCFGVN